ncbi:hypothetical protein QAD02_011886 [Eretmocerus hayati]|uniref:Uncharacterized protein n=1 Tax=Eretmocerus hayati TaxID=131215 RepID=A0ACC2NY29_9HYME|nr:hypothetical protein QAD02_011886 [Eretmocerus hayati]
MDSSNSVVEDKNIITDKIENQSSKLSQEVTAEDMMSLQADSRSAAEVSDGSVNSNPVKRIEKLEHDVTDVQTRLDLLSASFSQLSAVFMQAGHNLSGNNWSSNWWYASPCGGHCNDDSSDEEQQQVCSGTCCAKMDSMTSSELKIFCGKNMSVKRWVKLVESMMRAHSWTYDQTYVIAMEAFRGVAKKIVFCLVERKMLQNGSSVEKNCEETLKKGESFDRKLTDEQVLKREVEGEDLKQRINWLTLRAILMNEGNSEDSQPFPDFQSLLKEELEKDKECASEKKQE